MIGYVISVSLIRIIHHYSVALNNIVLTIRLLNHLIRYISVVIYYPSWLHRMIMFHHWSLLALGFYRLLKLGILLLWNEYVLLLKLMLINCWLRNLSLMLLVIVDATSWQVIVKSILLLSLRFLFYVQLVVSLFVIPWLWCFTNRLNWGCWIIELWFNSNN